MKRLKIISLLPLGIFMLTILALPAMADTYSVTDGSISDWGVNLGTAYSGDASPTHYSDGWKPIGHANVDYIVENNENGQGTHIKKTGLIDSPQAFVELPITDYSGANHTQPSGGESYDIEAMYFDDDNSSMYLAIVTSLPPQGVYDSANQKTWKMGDIALDITHTDGKTGDSAYEYGIQTLDNGSTKQGYVLKNPSWDDPDNRQFPSDGPLNCSGGNYEGSATIQYLQASQSDNGVPNYIIEAKIPKSAIGNPSAGQMADLHLTIGCGNDEIELSPVKFNTNVPEFPTVVLPFAAVMGLMLIFGRRNKD
jgi:hypothetical protein